MNNVPHLGNIIGCVLSADVYARWVGYSLGGAGYSLGGAGAQLGVCHVGVTETENEVSVDAVECSGLGFVGKSKEH